VEHSVTIVLGDDWQGIYVDGQMYYQHHHVRHDDWVKIINTYQPTIAFWRTLNDDGLHWLETVGEFPERFVDIPTQYFYTP
jgi:hypothetical protein